MNITRLEQMIDFAKEKPKRRMVVAYAQDPNTIGAVAQAHQLGLVDVILTGDRDRIAAVCKEKGVNPGQFDIRQEADEIKSGQLAVALVRAGEADILMKGLIATDKYMRCILDKEKGLLPPGAILSHVTVVENKNAKKLLIVSDVAIIPQPDLSQKIAIANYLIKAARCLGIEKPKLAVLAATEKANPKMQACVDAAVIAKMGDRGQIKNAIIDGPLALDVAIDPEACEIKGIKSPVAGAADCLLFPNIETGNIFYKTMVKLANQDVAAAVVGTKVPAILPSRGDSENSKLCSIALATLLQG